MQMEHRKGVIRYARRARARLSLIRGVEWTLRALFWASCLALVSVSAHKLFAVPVPVLTGSIGLGAAVLLVGLVAAFVPRLSLVEAAAAVDEKAGWKERLSSVMALRSVSHPMEHALVEDVGGRLASRPPSRMFPFRAPRELKFLPLVVVALIVAARLVPQLDLFGHDAARKEEEKKQEEITKAIEKLEKKKELLEKNEQLSERVKGVVDKIDALMKDLQQNPKMDQKEALSKIANLADELQKMKSELGKSQSLAEKIQKAAAKETADMGELGKMLKQGKFAEAAQELAKMRNALQEGKMSAEDKEKLKKQMEKLAEKLRKEMAKDKESKESKEFEKKLAKAMEGLEKGDENMMDGLQQSLDSLDGEMDDMESLAEALKDLEDLAEAMAKDKGKCPS